MITLLTKKRIASCSRGPKELHDTSLLQESRWIVSIHAPVRGGDNRENISVYGWVCFNPRPRARGRRKHTHLRQNVYQFQSTPPCEGATPNHYHTLAISLRVSIHAPVRGGDAIHWWEDYRDQSFNPRPRARGRRMILNGYGAEKLFQSTPPCEGATLRAAYSNVSKMFQSTPPCEGAT